MPASGVFLTESENPPSSDLPRRPLLAVVIASIFSSLIITSLVAYFGWQFLERLNPGRNLQPGDALDLAKFSLTVAAGVGAVIALVVSYRRQRVDEAAHHLAVAAGGRDRIRLLSERFSTASTLLGNREAAATRLAGVYAMAALADAWDEQRQSCVDVLCAYLRLPYDVTAPDMAERQVRFAVYSVIRGHLSPNAPVSWEGLHFDLSNADLFDGSLAGVRLSGGSLSLANTTVTYPGFSMDGAFFHDSHVDMTGIKVRNGRLSLIGAGFVGSTLDASGATIAHDGVLDFSGCVLDAGKLVLDRTNLTGGQLLFDGLQVMVDADYRYPQGLIAVSLGDANIDGGFCSFQRFAVRSNAPLGDLDRDATHISLSSTIIRNSIVSFRGVDLLYGYIRLNGIQLFEGKVSFENARVKEGRISLAGAVLNDGWVSFDQAEFQPSGDARDNYIVPPWLREVEAMSQSERSNVWHINLRKPPYFLSFSGARLKGGNISFEGTRATFGIIEFVGCRLEGASVWVDTFSFGSAVWDFWLSEFSSGIFAFDVPCSMVFLIDDLQLNIARPFGVAERSADRLVGERFLRYVDSLGEITGTIFAISPVD